MAMRRYLPLFFGYFAVMALSNAIVPVLPAYSRDASISGFIYAGYFCGAFLVTLPTGILTDRYGRIPFIRLGLLISLASGLFLAIATDPSPVVAGRFLEGLGSGLFVAAAMATINADPDHVRLSGWLMASQNAGLVAGLAVSGWLAASLRAPAAGIGLFSLILVIPATGSLLVHEQPHENDTGNRAARSFVPLASEYRWLWYSTIVLIGITGVASSLYPEHAEADFGQAGFWLALMSIATIATVLACSRVTLEPVPAIRISAVLMAGGVVLLYFSPAGFIILGAAAGAVMIAQMAYLAGSRKHQGTAMGLYSSFAYLGMAVLPAAAGLLASGLGFLAAYGATALAALSVAAGTGRCTRPRAGEVSENPPARNEQ